MTTTTTPTKTRRGEMRRNLAWLAAHPDLAAYAYCASVTADEVNLQAVADRGFRILDALPIGAQLVDRTLDGFVARVYRLDDGVLVRIVVEADQ